MDKEDSFEEKKGDVFVFVLVEVLMTSIKAGAALSKESWGQY